ncbi:MAG TPA: hypothetical protein VIS07_12065 [Candidatus Binatia bacterium]
MNGGCTRWSVVVASWAALTVLASLPGCGGSGSSGFDPAFLEGLVIEQALDGRTCLPHDELVICAAGASAGGPPNLPGLDALSIDGRVDREAFEGCLRARGEACRLDMELTGQGVPEGAELRLAVRLLPDGVWRVGAPFQLPVMPGTVAPTRADLEVGPLGDDVRGLQVAVLVFAAPRDVPQQVGELARTGARWAFVVALEATR